MATPLSASQFVAALKREGVKVSERYSGWRTHNRNHKGAWGGVNGIVIHHTAGRDSLALCYNGTSSLPGPLCHTHLAKDGTATMTSAGRANHAGTFAANAHNAVVNESANHPRPDVSEPVDGNAHYYGIEIENLGNGTDPYPRVQYDAAVRWTAAICRAHGWTANSVIGHKEGTRRKIDPRGPVQGGGQFDMDTFRRDVDARLKGSAASGATPSNDSSSEELDMDAKQVNASVWDMDNMPAPPSASTYKTNRTWKASSYFKETYERIHEVKADLTSIQAKLDAQAKTIDKLADALGTAGQFDPEALKREIREAIESVSVRLDTGE